jgi:DNA-binding beta-propeller fold protein YncE
MLIQFHDQGFEVSGFTRPLGLAVDKLNNIYVADMDLNTVFKISVPECYY